METKQIFSIWNHYKCLRANICKSLCLNVHFIPNNSDFILTVRGSTLDIRIWCLYIYRKISNCSRISKESPPPQTLKKMQFFDKIFQIGKPPIEATGRLFRFVKDQNFFQPKTYLRLPVSWKDSVQVLTKTCRLLCYPRQQSTRCISPDSF